VSEPGGVEALQEALREFARERNWEQHHTPKNLVMALSGEVGELADLFQWLTAEESRSFTHDPERRAAVEMELADAFQYLLRLADVLEVDLEKATWKTIERNQGRFPANGEVSRAPFPTVDDLVVTLADPTDADSPAEFPSDPAAVNGPGMYSWWASDPARDLLSGWLADQIPGLIYAGQAGATKWPSGTRSSATLQTRIVRNHIKGSARSSTFRKTLSAILLEPLDLSVGDGGKLTPESRARVAEWMHQHLKVKIAPFGDADHLGRIESEVLARLDPPLNIEGLPSTEVRRRITQLRRELPRG
jgi:NTP pyrophosphatase (non-canonical NTP hydrolase)